MAKVNAQQYAEKWGRRLKGSTQDIRSGVERVSTAPGMAAAKKSDKMLAGIQRAIADGTWQRAVSSVSLEDWKRATIDKGVGRIAAGVDGAMQKQEAMAAKLLGTIDTIQAKVSKMPDNTLEDRINRMTTFVRDMSAAKIK